MVKTEIRAIKTEIRAINLYKDSNRKYKSTEIRASGCLRYMFHIVGLFSVPSVSACMKLGVEGHRN